jgi:hypothetical protein
MAILRQTVHLNLASFAHNLAIAAVSGLARSFLQIGQLLALSVNVLVLSKSVIYSDWHSQFK